MKKLSVACCAVACALLPVGAGAVAPGISVRQAQYSIGISGFVPVICRASVDANSVAVTPGTVSLGSMREFCNSPNGYRVIADYSPSMAKAKLLVGGHPVQFSKDGSTVVSRSNQAAINAYPIDLQLPQGVSGGAISFRIEAL